MIAVAQATDWIDEQLVARGIERTGAVELPHVRPWSTVLRADTTAGPVWLKAPAPGTAAEVALYAILARVVPEAILVPLAIDAGRGWVLLPDGGPSLGARVEDARERARGLTDALALYGRLQRRLESHVDDLLAAGVADMRPAVMPGRFEELVGRHPDLAAHRAEVRRWCTQLEASPVPASLDHDDLHPFNVLGPPTRFYDWGDATVAHPFTAARLPLRYVRDALGDETAARDAYLAAWADVAPHAELVATLECACSVGKVVRVHVWERALATARHADLEPALARGPQHAAAAILDDDYLSGA